MSNLEWGDFDPALLARNIAARERPGGLHHPENCGPCEDCAEFVRQGYQLPDAASPALKQYIRHATRFGTELVYETAVETGLSPVELRRLRLELTTVDAAKGKAPSRRRRSRGETAVAVRMLAERGLTRREIAKQLGVSDKTVDNYLSPGSIRTTNHLRAAVSGMKTPANEGVEEGQIAMSGTSVVSAVGGR